MTNSTQSPPLPAKQKFLRLGIWLYIFALILLEVFTHSANVIYGALGHALLIFTAINHAVRAHKTPLAKALPTLAMLSLLRLASLIMPTSALPPQAWYVLIAIPVWVAIIFYLIKFQVPPAQIGLQRAPLITQIGFGLLGIPLGYLGFLILRPAAMFQVTTTLAWVASLGVIVLIALTEEMLFRGIILSALSQIDSRLAMLSTSILYMGFFAGTNSPGFIIFSGLLGGLFAYYTHKSKSLWGALLAHILFLSGIGLVYPLIFR